MPGLDVTAVLVSHPIESAAFVVAGGGVSVAYSGDTGPTDRFWKVLEECEDLRALVMEVSFPNDQGKLARLSGHHTPQTLGVELNKLSGDGELPILLFHIKPVFQAEVEKQLSKIRDRNLTILQLGDQFLL